MRAFKWYKRVLDINEGFGSGSFVLLELTQKVGSLWWSNISEVIIPGSQAALTSGGSLDATAWLHQIHHHTLGLGTGYRSESSCTEKQALQLLKQGLDEITNEPAKDKELEFFPNFIGYYTNSNRASIVIYDPSQPKDLMFLANSHRE